MLLISIFVMMLLSFLIGTAVEKLLDYPFSFSNAIMVGFITMLALFHVVAYPMVQLNATFTLLFWTYTGILLLAAAFALWNMVKQKTGVVFRQHTKELLVSARRELPLLLVTAGVALFTLFISCGHTYVTSDDSFYLPRAMEALSENRVGILHGFWWSGLSEQSFPGMVDASTLECWKAYWSYLFGMHPTVFCRNSLSLIVHFVSWCSLYQAYRSVSKHKGSSLIPCLFLSVYLILIVLDNRLANTLAFWTIRYPAQGKAMLCSIIYPALIFVCASVVDCEKNRIPWQKWLGIALVFTAGIATTIIGVFWPFLCCLTMGLPYLLIERRKDLHKLLLPLILACSPVIIYAGTTFLSVVTEHTSYLEFSVPNWYESMTEAINIHHVGAFVLCLIFTLILGSRKAKLILAGGCITLFATVLNPLFIGFVSKYLSTGSVYYRLFWMVPVYFIFAYTVAELFGSCKLRARQISVLAVTAVLVLAGGIGALKVGPREVYRRVNDRLQLSYQGVRRTNIYGLPESWYSMGSKLLENVEETESVRIIWLAETDCLVRQYSDRIELVGACRAEQWPHFDQPLEEGAISPLLLRGEFVRNNGQDFSDPVWAHEQLAASQIDYLCVSDYSGFAQRESVPAGFELFMEDNGIKIYRVLGQ